MPSDKLTPTQKLLAVQQAVGAVKKSKTNPYFNSKYFDINSLLEALKPALNEVGLILAQPLIVHEGKAALRTEIIDSETATRLMDSVIFLPEVTDPQKLGSAITYYRRYALQSLFALEAEDDDGNAASGEEGTTAKPAYDTMQDGLGLEHTCAKCGAGMIYKEHVKNGKTYKLWECTEDRKHVEWVK